MELIILGTFIILSNYLGYKMGKGEVINFIPIKFKPIIRTEEKEAKLVEKLRK